MKRISKSGILAFLLALAVAVCWWLSRPKKHVETKPDVTRFAATARSTPFTAVPEIVQPFAKTPMLGLADPRWRAYEAKRKLDPAAEWRTPIEFYGKVVDEKEQPVAGATVEISWNGTVEKYGGDGVGKRKLTSDANGVFVLSGEEGKGITVLASKDGYYRRKSWNGGSFEYAGFWEPNYIEPDRDKPVLFRLVKRPVAEPTYHVGQRSIAKPPTWQIRIDLLAQQAETSVAGDIELRIIRPPNPGYQHPLDWQLKIEGQSGAEISLSEEEFMLRAPDEGYQKVVTKEYTQVRGNSIEIVKFYVRNKARKLYAAVSLEVTPYYPNPITKE
ncbi:MAG: carboxypeptidase-like regulatory domain-containing protein, partial [Roseimicrobium sp.]